MPQPALQKSIAECLAEPTAEPDYALLQHMARVAKTHCLICGEQVQDIQEWRRHIKAKHEAQRKMVDELGQSSTLLAANLTRPCPWCDVYFQKSAKEHRKKCLPLLQLSLRHVTDADSSRAGTAAGSGVGPELSTCRDTDARTPRECGRARTNPGQPSKFRKGLGKGTHKSPQAKRSREQEAEEEFWMDQDQLDEETIKRILRLLVRAASRHEQQLTSLEADRSYVFFLEVGHHGLIGMLVQASQAWHQQFEAGTVTTSLRATLWGVLLLEWKTRLDKIENDVNALQTAETAHWITRTPLQWTYTEWNAEQKKALPASRDNLPHEEAKRAVNRLLKSTAKDGVVHRFQSLKPLKPDIQAEVVVMLLTLTIHQQAAEIYKDLDTLANNCVGKLIGLRLRRERVSKSALAKELEKLQL